MKKDENFSIGMSVYHPDEKAQKMIRMALQSGGFEKAMEIARSLHEMNLSSADIMKATGLSAEDVYQAGQPE